MPPAPDHDALCIRASSRGLDPRSLVPGRDLVLRFPLHHGLVLPRGVVIDDHLDQAARQKVDEDAHRALAAWRRQTDEDLTVSGICLPDIWHIDLFGQVFLPAVRWLAGIQAAFAASDARRIVCVGLDAEQVEAVREHLDPVPVSAESVATPPGYPSEDFAPRGAAARRPWQRLARRLLDVTGVRTLAWGRVLVLPYLSTVPVLERLTAPDSPRPVLHPIFPPPSRLALRVARRGGWIGLPGRRARQRAAAEADRRLTIAAQRTAPQLDVAGLGSFAHVRALRCLHDLGRETTAMVGPLQRGFASGRVRAVLLPFDHEPFAKLIIRVAQSAHVPTLLIQHGYESYRVFPTGAVADYVGVWSAWGLEAFRPGARARVRIVGNPGRALPVSRTRRPGQSDPVAVILVEHHSLHTAILDARITARHIAAAVEGLRRSGRPWDIIVRPHPADDVDEITRISTAVAADLGAGPIRVDGHSPVSTLLAEADLCVGAASTATLQAAPVGTRVVVLNVTGLVLGPPLDGSGSVVVVTDVDELARAVNTVMDAPEPPGASELLEALGATVPDPGGVLVDWLRSLTTVESRSLGARVGSCPAD